MDYYEKLKQSKNHLDRMAIASDKNCPIDLLHQFVQYDTQFEVVEAAALNLLCTTEMLEIAGSRFSQLKTEEFISKRERRLQQYLNIQKINELEHLYSNLTINDRDEIIRKHILRENYIDHASSHLGITNEEFLSRKLVRFVNPDVKWADTNLFRIAMIIAPAWGVLFPPYNVAKLTGLLRSQKYSVKAFDINIESYHRLLGLHGEDYWRSERYFLWLDKENFEKYLLPDLEPLFEKIILDLSVEKPKVVGFSIYNTNFHATMHLLERLKVVLPNTCFIAGGPEMAERFNCGYNLPAEFNYIFVGEAEQNLIEFLERLPTIQEYPNGEVIGNTTESRLNLDVYAYPDYSDYNLSNYQEKTGISAETSRGCVAQCSFCSETYYWKFRSLDPNRTISEIEHQINTYGIKRVWFVDSLINGNLKNFQKLVDLILEKNLKFSWNVYARCDGRMTADFFKKVAQSGCNCLSFGVESGSQKVLNNMRKKIEIWEIENNLRDAHNAKIFAHVNWMVGFPTEEPIDWMHSLNLLFNCRQYIHAISVGYGAGAAPGSHMKTDPDYYGISKHEFLGNWRDEYFNNTNLHRFLRIKLTHIWLAILNKHSGDNIYDAISYTSLHQFYEIVGIQKPKINYLEYDEYVYFPNDNFHTSLESEYLAFFYILYKCFGAFSMKIICDPELDKKSFGKFIAANYSSTVTIIVNNQGRYYITINHSFSHTTDDPERIHRYERERKFKDMSFSEQKILNGNISDWVRETKQVKPSIKEHKKKIITIHSNDA
jgi:anaerobic magnesium-protoporphyrin IX monomethyl ester cyclase